VAGLGLPQGRSRRTGKAIPGKTVASRRFRDALADCQPREKLGRSVVPETAAGWLHRAYALRRVNEDGLIVAWHALLPAAEKFPSEAVVAYNLSCYACQMNEMVTARTWLHQAIKVGRKEEIKKMALADEDLKPLWSEIQEL
jgi:hypothetical protein